MIYIVIFILLLCFSVFEISNVNRASHSLLILISSLMLMLLAGLRYETGGDWDIYAEYFEDLSLARQNHIEIGYWLLCYIVKLFGGGIQTVFFIIAVMNTIILVKAYSYYTKYVITCLFLYYCVAFFALDMICIRQSVSVAISLYAMRYVNSRNFLKYLFFILIACTFHRVSLLMIPLFFLFKYRFSNKIILLVVMIGAVFMLFNVRWVSFFILEMAQAVGGTFQSKIMLYYNNEIYGVDRMLGIGFLLNILILLALLWKRKSLEKFPYGNALLNMYILSLVVYYYIFELVEISDRLRLSYKVSLCVLLPMLIESYSSLINRFLLVIFCSAYGFLLSKSIFMNYPESAAFHPYQNYLYYRVTEKKSTGQERLDLSNKYFREKRKGNASSN